MINLLANGALYEWVGTEPDSPPSAKSMHNPITSTLLTSSLRVVLVGLTDSYDL